MLPALLILGFIGTLAVWLFGIRPYVVSNNEGYKTGANLGIAMWVDWQSCGEIAKATNDSKGNKIYLAFGLFQIIFVVAIILLFISSQ